MLTLAIHWVDLFLYQVYTICVNTILSMVNIKTEGENHEKRLRIKSTEDFTPESFAQMQHEILYLKQEVEFLKKIYKETNTKRRQ